MFKFIGDKKFFYFCAILSIVATILTTNLLSHSITSVFVNILIILFLLMMIVFNRVEHKELMKVLTASFLQLIIVKDVAEFNVIVEPVIASMTKITDLFNVNNITFRGATLIVATVLLLILYINHFVINFTGNASKVAININKVVVTVYFILMIIVKIVLIVNIYRNLPLYNTMPSKLKTALALDGIPTMIYALTVVAMEAFVNKEREKKA